MKTVERLLPGRRIGTTSYIFPAGETAKESYEKNIELLAPHIGIIQLLLLGRDYGDIWQDKAWLNSLVQMKLEYGLDFVVHLPLDLHIWPDMNEKHFAIMKKLLGNLESLEPSGYVLHLEKSDGLKAERYIPCQRDKEFFGRLMDRLASLGKYPFLFENTHYDLCFFAEEIYASPFGVCFDIGHWWLLGRKGEDFFQSFQNRIRLVHVHGIQGEKDHQSLAVLSSERLQQVLSFEKHVPLIIEVFSLADLVSSLIILKSMEKEVK
ncbi:MAG: cobamide remodeling phosphodiesterase CbiR [Brevinematales bacterium]